MILLYLLIVATLIILVLLFTVASKIIVHFNSEGSDLNVTLLWLYPIVKSVVSSENENFILSVYIFNKRILQKKLKMNGIHSENKNFLSKIKPTDIHIQTQYGFKDPSFTGLIFGVISIISRFFTLESLYQRPNFFTDEDFINFDATARLNLGRFLLQLV